MAGIRWLIVEVVEEVDRSAVGASIPIAPEKFFVKDWVQKAVKRDLETDPFGPSLSIVKGIASPSVNAEWVYPTVNPRNLP